MQWFQKGRIFLLAALAFVVALDTPTASDFPLSPEDEPVARALQWLSDVQRADGAIGSYRVSAWATMSIFASGQDPHTWRRHFRSRSVVDQLELHVKQLRRPATAATDFERNLLAITAAPPEDPTSFGGMNFVQKVKEFFDGEQIGIKSFLNDDFFGILSLRSAGESPDSEILQASRAYILENRNADGGWGFLIGFPRSDVDDTAAAVMALAALGNPEDLPVIDSTLQFLKSRQNEDGGFPFFGNGEASNAASTAWAIDAIVAAGDSPTDAFWESYTGSDPIDGLLSLQLEDGSFQCFLPTIQARALTTSYAIEALLGRPYPANLYVDP